MAIARNKKYRESHFRDYVVKRRHDARRMLLCPSLKPVVAVGTGNDEAAAAAASDATEIRPGGDVAATRDAAVEDLEFNKEPVQYGFIQASECQLNFRIVFY